MIEYEALLRLQDIDLQLMRYSRQLKAMPQQKKIAARFRAKIDEVALCRVKLERAINSLREVYDQTETEG